MEPNTLSGYTDGHYERFLCKKLKKSSKCFLVVFCDIFAYFAIFFLLSLKTLTINTFRQAVLRIRIKSLFPLCLIKDPTYHFDADPDPDPRTHQSDANLRSSVYRPSTSSCKASTSHLWASTALCCSILSFHSSWFLTWMQIWISTHGISG